MRTEINENIECANCGERLPEEWIRLVDRDSCPECGSNQKKINLYIIENVSINAHDAISGKVKDKNFISKKNPKYDFFEGDAVRKSDGKWMKKSRIINKYEDKYLENIVYPETGETVHHCEEPLSKHFDHGSAKFKKDEK